MPINPKIKALFAVMGFVLLLILPVSYGIYREYQHRKATANQVPAAPVTDSVKTSQ